MNRIAVNAVSISTHRATLQGYLVCLVGLLFVVENTLSVFTTGLLLTDISGIVLGLFAIGGGALSYLRPKRLPRGADPAPLYLFVLAGLATVFFGLALFALVS